MAFTLKERISLGIHGLQPPRFKTQEEQLALCKASVMKYTEDLNRYLYLVELQVSDKPKKATDGSLNKKKNKKKTFMSYNERPWIIGEEREIIFPSCEREYRADDAYRLHANCGTRLPEIRCYLSKTTWTLHHHL